MKHSPALLLLLLSLLLSCKQQPGSPSPTELHAQLDQLMDSLYHSGLYNGALLVSRQGTIVYDKAHGYADIFQQIPLDEHAAFRLASVSKQFTCMAVMMLKEAGKLNYDDLLSEYLPGFPYPGVTLRHLMTHTAGLPDYISLMDSLWDADKPISQRQTAYNRDAFNMLLEHRPPADFAPGDAWAYSNTAYVLLALVIEEVSGQRIQDFIEQRIFAPLGMHDSQVFSTGEDFRPTLQVRGFQIVQGDTLPNDWHYLNGMVGDGGLYASTRDLYKWDQALYTDKLVSQATLEEAFTPVRLNNDSTYLYGFGWGISYSPEGEKMVAHGGSWVGARTYIRRELGNKNCVILLTNNSTPQLQDMLQAIDDVLAGKPYRFPDPG